MVPGRGRMLPIRPSRAEAQKQGAAMTKLFAAGIAAVLLGGTTILVSGLSSSEARSTPIVAKSDRLDAKPYGEACSQVAWPYYEASCLRNRVGATREAKTVRVVSTDRAR